MRIRTQFILSMLLFGLVLVAVLAAAMLTNRQTERVGEQERRAQAIALGAGELNYLANDYLIYQEEQQLERWRARLDRFSIEVSGLRANRRDQQALVADIQADTQRLAAVFDSVVSGVQAGLDGGETPALAMLQVSRSRIAVQTQGLAATASRLAQMYEQQGNRLHQASLYAILALVAVTGTFFVVNYWIVQRQMLQSIARLREGTAIIGSGDLDFRIEEERSDEIGELSSAFNQMAADLQAANAAILVERQRLVTLNETLEQRVAARTAELRESEERLQVVFDALMNGVVVYDATGTAVRANPAAVGMLGVDPVTTPRDRIHGRVLMRHPGGEPLALEDVPSSRALRGERVVAMPCVYTHKDGSERHILASATPLLENGQIQGAVVIWHDITERQALEETRRLQAEERTIYEERQRMARDLHDAVSQTLFSASLTADVLPVLYGRDAAHGQQLLDGLKHMIRGALAELRTLLAELRPQSLLDTDLAMLVRQLAAAAAGRLSGAVTVHAEPVGPLPAEVQIALYRIAQEALHNVDKHSAAARVTVRLTSLPEPARRVELCIEDDGSGFDPATQPANAFGLHIMAERAAGIQAGLVVDSRPGAGTRVLVTWLPR